jgi:hypothetical protein
MKTVYKYPIPLKMQKFDLMLPENFKVNRIGFQSDQLFMWAEVVKDGRQVQHHFAAFGTGQDVPDSAKFLYTYDIGPFVLHLYLL